MSAHKLRHYRNSGAFSRVILAHPPLAPTHSSESFHQRWANAIADYLDRILPGRYFAEVHVTTGSRIEADVAEFETSPYSGVEPNGSGGIALQTWAPPAATATVPLEFIEEIEIQVIDQRGSARLVGAIELISPANKDREDHRDAFTAKCSTFLHRGIGLVIVDTVTARKPNLHHELMQQLKQSTLETNVDSDLYAASYRPAFRDDKSILDVWPFPLAVGEKLPVVPFCLRGGLSLPLDLESTYTDARRRARL